MTTIKALTPSQRRLVKSFTQGLGVLLTLLILVGHAHQASAIVAGTPLSRFQEFRLFGQAVSTGNTLMSNTPSQPLVNSILLSQSSAQINNIPRDATVEGAYLFWSGSIQGSTDENARLTLADGFQTSVQADTCFTSPVFEGFFYCRADVTDLVSAHPSAGSFNGLYTVSDVNARAAALDNNGQCINQNCQARYAGWSLVVVYNSPSETTQRDIVLYDGFRQLDENELSAGIDTFTIDGFEVADPPQGSLSFFALEGDALLGIPPQDQDPNADVRCTDCFDYIALNGTKLSDPNNPPNNVFNSTTPAGGALGVDIDTFDISSLVRPGDSSITIEAGSGDGRPSFQGGGGESFFLGYLVLSLNRLSPNFQTANTFKAVDPQEAGPGETVFFTLNITNDGSLDAANVTLRDPLDSRLEYVANSLRVDGQPVPEANGIFPLAAGLSLGSIRSDGDNDVRVTFRARVRENVPNGATIPNTAVISSPDLIEPSPTNEVTIRVQAPTIGQPTKSGLDLDGGDLEPEDLITYTIFIPNESDRTASGIQLVDDMPPFVRLRSVNIPAGATDNSNTNGGLNGTGRVDVQDIVIPAAVGGVSVSYTVQVFSTQELLDAGVPPEDIDGLTILNQGRMQAPFLPADLLTDDPSTPASPDPTILRITSSINLRNPNTFKSVEDVNGGNPNPGDTLRYTINLSNTGNSDATVTFQDDLPPRVRNFTLETPLPEVSFAPAPAGVNNTGRLSAINLIVPARSERTIQFTVQIDDDTPGGLRIQNVANVEVREDPSQDQALASDTLTVVSGADVSQSTKEILNPPPGGFQPGDPVEYRITVTNSGNRPATNVTVQDDIALNLNDITPQNGGNFDAGRRRITWSLGDLAAGQSTQLTFSATINSPLPNGTSIRNQGVVFADNLEGGTVTDDPATVATDDPTTLTVQSVPSLVGSTKSVRDLNGGDIEPGDPVEYTITVTNTGRDTANNVTISDPIDPNLTDIQPQNGGSLQGNALVWNPATTPTLASLPAGNSATLTFTATIANNLPDGTVISNQATLSAQGIPDTVSDDPATPEPLDPTILAVRATPDLSTSLKSVNDQNGGAAQPGDLLIYTITLVNTGNGPARGVAVSDPIDPNLANISPEDGGTFDNNTRTITWQLAGPIPAGGQTTVSFAAIVAPGLPNGTIISNQATVSSIDIPSDALTDDPRNGVGDDDPTTLTVETRPDFVNSTKFVRNTSGDPGFRPGDTVEYTITVRNSGTTTANNVSTTDRIPTQLINITPLDGGTLSDTNLVTWNTPTLEANQELELRVQATITSPLDDGTQVSNQAFITSTETPDPTPTDNPNTEELDDPVLFTVSSRPVFTGSQKTFQDSNEGSQRPGDLITYTLQLVNSGTSSGRNVVVSDILDENLVNIQPGTGTFDAATRTLTWNSTNTPALASVPPEGRVELTFTATLADAIPNGTIVSNQATITSDELDEPELTDDPRTGDFPDPTSFPVVSAADLTGATKTVAPPADGSFRPGTTVSYTIQFTNEGDAPATNVTVTDTLDPNLIFSEASDNPNVQPPTVTWDASTTPALRNVAPGQTITLTLNTLLTAPIPNGTEVFNQARISADGFVNPVVTDDPSTPEIDDPTLLNVTSAPSLTASTKTVRDTDGDGFFEPGDVIEYAITVRNDGDDTARNVTVSDPIDTTNLTNITPLDGGTLQGNTASWSSATTPALASINPGEAGRQVVRVRATIRPGTTNNTRVTNQALVDADDAPTAPTDDPDTAALDDTTNFRVTSQARLDSFAKRVEDLNGDLIEPGDRLRYTLTIQNEGTENGRNVQISDPIDANLTDIRPEDGGTLQGNSITWNLDTVQPGETFTVSFEATVRGGTEDGTRIVNQALLSADDLPAVIPSDDPANGLGDDNPTVVIVNARPELTFTKSSRDLNGGFVAPGDTLEFTLTLSNSGTGPARNVTLRDPIDTALLDNITPGQNGSLRAGIVTWTSANVPQLEALQPGETIAVTLTATVRPEVPNGTVILNQGNLSAADDLELVSDNPDTAQDNDPTRVTVSFPEIRTLSKSGQDLDGGLLEAGDRVEYSILLEAGRGEDLTNVRVTDPIDPLLEDIRPIQGGVFNPNTRTITWDANTTPALGRIPAGVNVSLGFSARILAEAEPGARITNQATATTPAIPDLQEPSDDPANGLGDRNPTVLIVETEALPDLSRTTKTVTDNNGGTVRPNDTLTYTIRIENNGLADSGELSLLDPLPALVSFVPNSLTINNQPFQGNEALLLTEGVSIQNLPPGGSATATFQVRVNPGTPDGSIISNQAVVTSLSGPNPAQELTDDPSTVAVNDPTQIVVGAAPNLTATTKIARILDENDNGTLDRGELLEYEIRIPNRGNVPATGAIFVDELPDNATYVPGSLRINNTPVTDADDGDPAFIEGSTLTVILGTLQPGQAPTVQLRVRADSGTEIVNQGRVFGENFPEEQTDADGNDNNGDQPTITPIGARSARLTIAKTVNDNNGDTITAGDELLYTITVTNVSTVAATNTTVTDPLPAQLEPLQVVAAPSDAQSSLAQTTVVRGFTIQPGQTRTIVLRTRLRPNTPNDTRVCNNANVSADSVINTETLEDTCVTVGARLGSGTLSGRVFQDTGERDGSFSESDIALNNFLVRAYRRGTNTIVQEVTTDENGSYNFDQLPGDNYDLRVFAQPSGSNPVFFGSRDNLAVLSGERLAQDVLVDPSGRIYNSLTGDLISGAEVLIFYADEDPNPNQAGKLVAPEDLAEGQQGQLTIDGLYRFDVRPGNLYRIEVVAPSQSLTFPSVRIPAEPDFWNPDDDPRFVVDNPIPDLNAETRYFTKFNVRDTGSIIENNHIPLDALSTLIQLDKRSNKREVTIGDIITYTITVTNRSNQSLLYNPETNLGGVYIRDIIPRGLRFVPNSARLRRVIPGRPTSSVVAEPQGKITLNFGLQSDPNIAPGRPVPLSLAAGETIELNYQLVVSVDAKTERPYTNRAILVTADGRTPISNEDRARIRVVNDPIFDQGIVIGKVFCDTNANGRQDQGERGIHRARVFLDNGWYSITDSTGKYHFQDVDPGNHLIKLDPNSLTPGSELTTDVRRVFYTTRGLPTKINFGATCPENVITDVELAAGDELTAQREALRRQRYAQLSGTPKDHTLTVEGTSLSMPTATLTIAEPQPAKDEKTNTKPKDKKTKPKPKTPTRTLSNSGFNTPLIFQTSFDHIPPDSIESFTLHISPTNSTTTLWQTQGEGAPPKQLSWDGLPSPKSPPTLSDGAYTATLTLFTRDAAIARSAPALFGVQTNSKTETVDRIFNGLDLFEKNKDTLSTTFQDRLRSDLRNLIPRNASNVQITIGVHSDEGDKPRGKNTTQDRAQAVASFLQNTFKLQPNSTTPKGFADSIPLVPNTSKANRAINARVELKITTSGLQGPTKTIPPLKDQALTVSINDKLASINKDGSFSETVLKPSDGLLVVTYNFPNRSSSTRRVNVRKQLAAVISDAPAFGKVAVTGNLKDQTVSIDNTPTDLKLLKTTLAPPKAPLTLEQGTLKPYANFALSTPNNTSIDRYTLTILDADLNPIFTQDGAKQLPKSFRWSGSLNNSSAVLLPGWHFAKLTFSLPNGTLVSTAPVAFQIQAPAPETPRRRRGRQPEPPAPEPAPTLPSSPPQAFLLGKSLKVFTNGSFKDNVSAPPGSLLLFEMRLASGARIVTYLPVPKGNQLETPPTIRTLPGPDVSEPLMDVPKSSVAPQDPPKDPKDTKTPKAPKDTTKTSTSEPSSSIISPLWTQTQPNTLSYTPRGADSPIPLRTTQRTPQFQLQRAPLLAQNTPTTTTTDSNDPKPSPTTTPQDPLAGFEADLLADALRKDDQGDLKDALKDVPAGNLKVNLPPKGVKLKTRELVVSGSTDPTNEVLINGNRIEVVDGEFSHPVQLPTGESELVIETRDKAGNRGTVRWPIEVADVGYFLMAFADTGVATEGAELDGMTPANSTQLDNGTLLYGQARLYLKGYMSGSKFLDNFFKEYKYTAYFDTSRQAEFEDFLTDTVQPEAYYPIYGDSSELINDVNAQGKVYIMVEADDSTLRVGNSRAALQGVQFFRYDKPFYGATVDFNKVLGEGYKTRVKAFVTDEEQPVQHTFNYLRGTGGSIYFLRHDEMVEGTEKITLVVKDDISGIELARIPQTRNVDYTVDYRGGRLLFKSPIPSVMRGSFIASRVSTTQQALEGNPVFIEVSYDYTTLENDPEQSLAFGGQAKETFYDTVTVGVGYVQENRDTRNSLPDYELFGAELGLEYTPNTKLVLEYAQSASNDSNSFFSSDGGLTFNTFTQRPGTSTTGEAFIVTGNAELGDLWTDENGERRQFLSTRAWFQTTSPGFFSNGTILEQGQDKYGAEAIWKINTNNRLRLRRDSVVTTIDDLQIPNPQATNIVERDVHTAQYIFSNKDWTLTSEFTHSYFDDNAVVDGIDTNIIAQRAQYRFNEQWSAYVGQQWVIDGDERIYNETSDRFQTELGVDYAFRDDWSAQLSQQYRWNGTNATQIGLTTKMTETSTVYVKERILTREDNDGVATTSIVGGEERFADGSGRMYSEYHVDSGIDGSRSRAVLGLGKGFRLMKGLTLDFAYERSQTVDESGFAGDQSRDVISAGWELLKPRFLKFSQKLELRYDDADSSVPQTNPCFTDGVLSNPDFCADALPGGMDKMQFLTANNLTLTFWRDHNLLARFILSTTNNLTLDREEERRMEASFGYALRPVEWDWANLLLKYTYLQNMRPLSLLDWREEREHAHVVSLVPILELPFNFQLVEKLAFKRNFVRFADLPEVESDTWLWINRINYHLTQTVDASVEYRFLHNDLSDTLKHGALLEVAYIFAEYARLGAGYNFTSFSDNELSDLNRDVGGFFIRLQGTY